jgi:phosphoketolase
MQNSQRTEAHARSAGVTPGKIDAYWRAANYLSVGQIYLYDNPLLTRPLAVGDVKHMPLGHWGTTPGQNFIYVHLNRVIKKYDVDMIYVSGPGHGGPASFISSIPCSISTRNG